MIPGFVQTSFGLPAKSSSSKRPRRQALTPRHTLRCQDTRLPNSITWKRPVHVALTRESGKNTSFRSAAERALPSLDFMELPCVETVPAEGRERLPNELTTKKFDWIVITSPEAASIFIAGWRNAGNPPLGRLAAVGKATGDKLRAYGLDVAFEPTKATGKTLVREFEKPQHDGETVLYPASAKASDVIVNGLTEREYSVVRLNTYSTETTTFDDQQKIIADEIDVVTFASPSAVKGWVNNMGVNEQLVVACIGETSASAARSAGFGRVNHPEFPGIEGWISAIAEATRLCESAEVEIQI